MYERKGCGIAHVFQSHDELQLVDPWREEQPTTIHLERALIPMHCGGCDYVNTTLFLTKGVEGGVKVNSHYVGHLHDM